MRLSQLILYGVLCIPTIVAAFEPKVRLTQGAMRGKVMRSRKGNLFSAFQGIPYAAPPVGKLRFQSPQRAPSWEGERSAVMEGTKCLQWSILIGTGAVTGSEDCLYLNVYTPRLNETAKLSVMFWIHGGGFVLGSSTAALYGPNYLLDHEIVLVTINYRIGPFGFLSLGNSEVPGNAGLKDQLAALIWVQENIAKFGGDPKNVTIFGESAGGASVQYLMHSKRARGLFQRAILQSGCSFNPWTLTKHGPLAAHHLGSYLGCGGANLLRCLRDVDPVLLTAVAGHLFLSNIRQANEADRVMFCPTVEPAEVKDAIITEDPRELLNRGEVADVPVMAGLMTHEGVLRMLGMLNWTIETDYQMNFGRFLPPGIDPQHEAVLRLEIARFYGNLSGGDFEERYVLVNSDVDFVLGVDSFVRGMAALERSPVFYYQFSYDGGLGLIKKLRYQLKPGTAHGDELGYLFSQELRTPILPDDQLTIERITTLWTNFAKFGDPTPDKSLGVTWLPVKTSGESSTRYLDIGYELVMHQDGLNEQRIAFWEQLLANLSAQSKTNEMM